jgi:hypothetical protein
MIEGFSCDPTNTPIKQGVFQNIEQLITAIRTYIDVHNKKPRPFIWIARTLDILEKVTRAQDRTA